MRQSQHDVTSATVRSRYRPRKDRAGVEHVQDGADQQRMVGLLLVVSPLQRALRIDQDIGDVLQIAHLVGAATQ